MNETRPTDGGPLLADRVYGAVALLLVALAAFFALRGGAADGTPAPVPLLTLIEPAPDSVVPQPVTLLFDADVPLRPAPSGWGTGDRHLHVRVGETELMPGTADVQHVEGTRYRWVLPRLAGGTQRVQLFWSDAAHRPLAAGASREVRVRIQ